VASCSELRQRETRAGVKWKVSPGPSNLVQPTDTVGALAYWVVDAIVQPLLQDAGTARCHDPVRIALGLALPSCWPDASAIGNRRAGRGIRSLHRPHPSVASIGPILARRPPCRNDRRARRLGPLRSQGGTTCQQHHKALGFVLAIASKRTGSTAWCLRPHHPCNGAHETPRRAAN